MKTLSKTSSINLMLISSLEMSRTKISFLLIRETQSYLWLIAINPCLIRTHTMKAEFPIFKMWSRLPLGLWRRKLLQVNRTLLALCSIILQRVKTRANSKIFRFCSKWINQTRKQSRNSKLWRKLSLKLFFQVKPTLRLVKCFGFVNKSSKTMIKMKNTQTVFSCSQMMKILARETEMKQHSADKKLKIWQKQVLTSTFSPCQNQILNELLLMLKFSLQTFWV